MTQKPLHDLSRRQACVALVALIVGSTLVFSYLAWLKHASFNHFSQDTAIYGHAFHQTLHGQFLPSYIGHNCLWANHADFFQLLWLPIYWLAPGIYSLFVFQSLMISLAAWPIYLLAHRVTGNRLTALIAAAGLLLFPPVTAVHLAEFHDDPMGLASLLFALYFFETKNFGRFAGCLAASLMAKEAIALHTIFFGVYALLQRRGWKWVVFPFVWSAAYMLVMVKVVMPYWGSIWTVELYSHMFYFNEWGKTSGEVIVQMLTHPLRVAQTLCSADRLEYLLKLLGPLLLVLPFGSAVWVVALPPLLVNLLSSNELMRALDHWYGILVGGLLWGSFLVALPAWNRRLTQWFGPRDYHRGLCLVTLLAGAASSRLWLRPDEFRPGAGDDARRTAIRTIPADATVFSSDNLLAHFADHPDINSLHALVYQHQDLNHAFDFDFIVFDRNYEHPGWGDQWRANETSFFQFIAHHPNYKPVLAQDNVFVFQRVGTPPRTLHMDAPALPDRRAPQ